MNWQPTLLILTYFLTQGNGFVIKSSSTWQLWITQPSKTKLYQYLGSSLKFWRIWILPHSKISWHTYFMAPFYGRGSTASRLDPLRGGSFLFTTKYPGITGTHFINLGRVKGCANLRAIQRILNKGPMDWESSALTNMPLHHTFLLYHRVHWVINSPFKNTLHPLSCQVPLDLTTAQASLFRKSPLYIVFCDSPSSKY